MRQPAMWALLLAALVMLPAASVVRGAAPPKPGQTFQECRDCPLMRVVPAGQFTMGAAEGDTAATPDETPRHAVTIEHHFAVGVYVTSGPALGARGRLG